VVGVTSSCEATRQRFYRNYAKCGPYVEESRGSAVKVVPGMFWEMGMPSFSSIGEGCQRESVLTGACSSLIPRRSRSGTYERKEEKRGRPCAVLTVSG